MSTTTEQDHLVAVSDRLGTLFPDTPAAAIEQTVAAEHARFDGHKVRDFVPLLVERKARAALHRQDGHQ